MAVIGQSFDDAAIPNAAVPALVDHPGKLGLEGGQAADPAIDRDQVIVGDAIDLVAGGLRSMANNSRISSISKPSSREWRMKFRRSTSD